MPRSPEEELTALDAGGLRRHLATWDGPQGRMARCGGQERVTFASNDYLGLAAHPTLAEAACRAARDHGIGAGAARLLGGGRRPHADLEDALARFKGSEAALTFGSGFAAGTGTLAALLRPGDTVILDKLSHACLVDGARASGATLRVFPHNDLDQLDDRLRRASEKMGDGARLLVVTESVFSMDGDSPPLAAIVDLKDRYGAWLMLDEAHATGVRGPGGRGLAFELGLAGRVEIQMGTLSKALGTHGGFVAASRPIVDLLVNKARPFIYATAPPPPVAAAASAALDLCQSSDGDARRARLVGHRALFADLTGAPVPENPIIPWIIGGEEDALDAALALDQAGLHVPAVRYPTVARGAARLRISLSAAHLDRDVELLVETLPRRFPGG